MRIVVGVDGSAHAQRALRWAVDVAARRQAELTVVYAYPLPQVGPDEMVPSDYDLRHRAEQIVAKAIADAAPPEGVIIRSMVRPVRKSPAAALIDEAKGADMLVVGSRGLGGFMALRLGSVSSHVAAHSPCPVVILPPVDREA